MSSSRAIVMQRAHLQMRLQNIFTSLDTSAMQPFFYTNKEGPFRIFFLFDNGIDPEPLFSGSIRGELYIDEKKNLVLQTKPLTCDEPIREEKLFSCIAFSQFSFLGEGLKKKPIFWKTRWEKSTRKVPAIIRLEIEEKKGEKPIQFAFILPTADSLITYKKLGRG